MAASGTMFFLQAIDKQPAKAQGKHGDTSSIPLYPIGSAA